MKAYIILLSIVVSIYQANARSSRIPKGLFNSVMYVCLNDYTRIFGEYHGYKDMIDGLNRVFEEYPLERKVKAHSDHNFYCQRDVKCLPLRVGNTAEPSGLEKRISQFFKEKLNGKCQRFPVKFIRVYRN